MGHTISENSYVFFQNSTYDLISCILFFIFPTILVFILKYAKIKIKKLVKNVNLLNIICDSMLYGSAINFLEILISCEILSYNDMHRTKMFLLRGLFVCFVFSLPLIVFLTPIFIFRYSKYKIENKFDNYGLIILVLVVDAIEFFFATEMGNVR